MVVRRHTLAGRSRSARHLLCLLAVANLAACAAFASCASLATPLAQRRRVGNSAGAAAACRARMSSAAPQDGAGRLPPKPLAKYSTEPVGTNLPKADSAKYSCLCYCNLAYVLLVPKYFLLVPLQSERRCLACVLLVPIMQAPHPWACVYEVWGACNREGRSLP